ncbi:hypothetical protein Glove_5g71 [Diversispora epigaea]|uniref:TLDc domain-containing protein n=1 Tax=Diversispora epigaea TaxID=1348612 RepID=A0A397JVQ0_9GLOM|nr:hypothetical protein Glove_5g71 [Diversispora epigaea]
METNDSFIFSLKNGNIKNSILSRVIRSSGALHYHNEQNMYGPLFGRREFMIKSDKQCQCDALNLSIFGLYSFYEKPIRISNELFSIVDYEVFKLTINTIKQVPG